MALRTPLSVTPHLYMGDSTGRPLDKGVVYFGEQDKDPEFYPINLFSDDALTLPLAQPVHTKGGYLYDKGDMVEPHAKEIIYSVKVLDSYGRKVFYKGAMMRNSWNDDVIERIDTAIIESQGAAVVAAEKAVNDAINNTAVEGGVLADTFVTVENKLNQRQLNRGLSSVAEMLAIVAPTTGLKVTVNSYHVGKNRGGGEFVYDASLSNINDGGNVINGWVREGSRDYLNVHNFGGIGDGTDNPHDDLAFKRIAQYITESDSKAYFMHIPTGLYLVGKQDFVVGEGFTNSPVFSVDFATMQDKLVVVQSDGATMKFKDGMHYGVFNKTTKARFDPEMPYHPGTASYNENGANNSTASIGFMLRFNNLKGLMLQGSIKLDGNRDGMVIGGTYGDTGWQIGAGGLYITRVENITVYDVDSDDHVQDGLYIAGSDTEESIGKFYNMKALRNSRQGMSLTGGRNLSFYNCKFDETGTPELKISSMPKAGVDIEAEISAVRNINFYNCYFGRASSQSMVAESYDTASVYFHNCEFINNLGSAIWTSKPDFKFYNCYINGAIEKLVTFDNEKDRTVFDKCTVTDDPSRNPNIAAQNYLIVLNGSNAIFNDLEINSYKSGGIFANGKNIFNNVKYNLYGQPTDFGWSVNDAIVTMRIKDYRPAGSGLLYATFARCEGEVVIDIMPDKANNISVYGKTAIVHNTPVPDALAYRAKVATVADATATDDTATKLNALIANMKAAGLMT